MFPSAVSAYPAPQTNPVCIYFAPQDIELIYSPPPALIFKSEVNWSYQFALCVSRASPTTINCLCIGLSDAESSSLLSLLSQFAHLAPQHDLLVPIVLLSLTCRHLSELVQSYQNTLWLVQEETGLYGRAAIEKPRNEHPWDFSRLIWRLTGLSDSYARMLSRIGTVKRMVGVVEEEMVSRGEEEQSGDGGGELRAQMRWVRQTVEGSEHYVKWFQSSSADQMKTVGHSVSAFFRCAELMPRRLPISCSSITAISICSS